MVISLFTDARELSIVPCVKYLTFTIKADSIGQDSADVSSQSTRMIGY